MCVDMIICPMVIILDIFIGDIFQESCFALLCVNDLKLFHTICFSEVYVHILVASKTPGLFSFFLFVCLVGWFFVYLFLERA